MLFSFISVERVVAEPDSCNKAAHLLAQKAGFVFQKEVQLPDKRARLYMITKVGYQKRVQA
nr:acetyltransferase [Niabella ginsengisoli]